MEDIDKDFIKNVKKVILSLQIRILAVVHQENMRQFQLRASGVSCVIAETLQEFFIEMQLILDYQL